MREGIEGDWPYIFTDAEFERMVCAGAFEDMRVELRGGALHRMNAQHGPHLRIKSELGVALTAAAATAAWLAHHAPGSSPVPAAATACVAGVLVAAFPRAGCEALATFMAEFEKANG